MSESLFLRYRPTSFRELIGQDLSAAALSRMVDVERVPQGLLFSGPSGSGKTSAARILASSMGYTGSSVIEVDAASNRGVEHVRSLIDALRYSSGGNIVILDEAHNLTREAFNALLKTLEEPSPGTVFVLLTTEPSKIPDTILSRLMEFEFRRISPADILSRLVHISLEDELGVPEDVLHYIADESEGNLRTAIVSLEKAYMANIESVQAYRDASGSHSYGPYLVATMLSGDHSRIFQALDGAIELSSSADEVSYDLLSTYRDLLVLRAGGSVQLNQESTDILRRLSVEIPRERLISVVKLMWDLRTKMRNSSNPRGALEMLVILSAEILSDGRPVSPAPVVESKQTVKTEPSPASLSDLRAI